MNNKAILLFALFSCVLKIFAQESSSQKNPPEWEGQLPGISTEAHREIRAIGEKPDFTGMTLKTVVAKIISIQSDAGRIRRTNVSYDMVVAKVIYPEKWASIEFNLFCPYEQISATLVNEIGKYVTIEVSEDFTSILRAGLGFWIYSELPLSENPNVKMESVPLHFKVPYKEYPTRSNPEK